MVGIFSATSLAGGHEQLQRMLDLLMDAVRRPAGRSGGRTAGNGTAGTGPEASSGLPVEPGLCGSCVYAVVKDTNRGTTYLRCTRASWDDRLVKYPRLPVTTCAGFAQRGQQQPGQQEPGQQEPGQQEPGQQEPGQQEPGQQQQPGSR